MLVCCQLDTIEPQTIDNELVYECFIQVIQSLVQLIIQVRIACGPWPPAQAMTSIRLKDCMRSVDTPVICFLSDTWMNYEERIIYHIELLTLGRKSLLSHLDESSTKIMDSAAALHHNIHHHQSNLSIGLVEKYAMNIGQLISMVGDFRVCRYSNTVYDSECLQYFTNFFIAKHAISTALKDLLRSLEETNKQSMMVMIMAVLRSSEEMVTVAKAILANPSYARYVVADFCSLRTAEFQNLELERVRTYTKALVRIKKRHFSKSFSQKQGVIITPTNSQINETNVELTETSRLRRRASIPFLNRSTNNPSRPRVFSSMAVALFTGCCFPRRASHESALSATSRARATPSELTYVTPTGNVFHPHSKSIPNLNPFSSGITSNISLRPAVEPRPKILTHVGSVSGESLSVPYAPFLCRDYQENDITFNANGVTGGTLEALVEMLTPHDNIIDDDYAKAFLLTFRSFCTPTVLLDKLICRFNLTPPSGLMLSQQQMWKKHKLLPIRLHVYNILKLWLESYFFDSDGKVILKRIGRFVQGPSREALTQVAAAQLTELVHDKIASIFAKPAADPQLCKSNSIDRRVLIVQAPMNVPPPPRISKAASKLLVEKSHISLLDIHPLEVARQLTLLVSKIFCSITPSELINHEFSKPTHDSTATFVIKKAQISTRITSLITRLILSEPEGKQRAAWVKFFIEVAKYLLSLRNYGTLVSIMCALQTSAVIRLRQTWKLVPEKHMRTMESLRELTNHARNYQTLRKQLRVATTPSLPFLGIYLMDLTFADEGNPIYRTSLQGSAPIINFSKCQRIARIIQEIQRFQVPYNLIEVVELQTQFNLLFIDQAQNYTWSERHMHRLSLVLEPRQVE
ncbi:Ras guanine nucleotide exchange factor bud5 [Massospora cicadina]|nr:Ras guanine nucleotide exchange factor bud5 [Massospora cicadina]